jgi:hypothetical protein
LAPPFFDTLMKALSMIERTSSGLIASPHWPA